MMRVAVIGCGAIADSFHLPALRRGAAGDVALTLVDPVPERADALARKHGPAETARSHMDILGKVDAAIVASPHHTHFPVAMDLLAAGIPVLSEKPLGVSVREVEQLGERSRTRGVPIAVNQTRRFIPACQEIRRILERGDLGTVSLVTVSEGDKFGWPAATPSMFGLRSGGQGVLLDIGVHVLDLLAWWFGPELRVESYHDDSLGGSEASVLAELNGYGTGFSVRLSWLARQRNRVRIEGSEATLDWGVYDLDVLTLRSRSGRTRTIKVSGAPDEFAGLATFVVRDFSEAVSMGRAPAVGPVDVLPSMRFIEECYLKRQRFDMPWHTYQEPAVRAR